MYLSKVADFIEFLSVKEHKLEEILRQIVVRAFSHLNGTSAFISELQGGNQVKIIASFAISQESANLYESTYSLDSKLPLTDCLSDRRTVWINTLPIWPNEYPILAASPYNTNEKSFICIPIEKHGTPVAALGVFSSLKLNPDQEIEAFLRAISNILGMYIYRNEVAMSGIENVDDVQSTEKTQTKDLPLTERQEVILRMMSEGRTNSAIGRLMGYSESTIKQETMKIFTKLGCNDRDQASQIYLERIARKI